MATAPLLVPDVQKRPRRSALHVAGRSYRPDVFPPKPIDNSRLVREIDPVKRRQCYALLRLGAVVFLFIFCFALQHFECMRYGYQIEQLKSERAALRVANQKLRLEQALLADPQRIDKLARADLGLTSPEPQQVVRLDGADAQQLQSLAPVFARNFEALAPMNRGVPREP
jgi:cell division protein FtsL